MDTEVKEGKITKKLFTDTHPLKLLLSVVIVAILLGSLTGYILSNKGSVSTITPLGNLGAPKTAQQDTGTFRDFAEGIVKIKPEPKDPTKYTEGTHTLEREGAVPVALTSSVVDLSQYEGKKVKVYGETQKAIKEGWLMDVGKVEEIQ